MAQKLLILILASTIFLPNVAAAPAAVAVQKIDNVVIESIGFATFKDPKRKPTLQIYLRTKETLSISCGDVETESLIDPTLPFYVLGSLTRTKKGKIIFRFRSKGDLKLVRGILSKLRSERHCANVI